MTKDIINTISSELKPFRRELHANPEVSQNEFKTAERITSYLRANTSASIHSVGKTGVIAVYDSGVPGPTIMLRADSDALPIQEINTFEHRSITDGVSHKCGHDGHSTIMLGVARALEVESIKTGKAILLWQPAEENGMGAQETLDDPYFKHIDIDYAFALHNLPGFSKNEIILKKSFFTSHVKSLIIKLHGKTAHAAEPEHGYNPAMAISHIIQYCEELTHNKPEDDNFFLITPIYINMGSESHGISAGFGEFHLTIRSWSPRLFDKKCAELQSFIRKTADEYHLNPDLSWTQEFFANENNEEAVDCLERVANKSDFKYNYKNEPFKWGEDFGLFTQKFKGAMFGLGAGKDTPALHNPDYDYPDDITATGIEMFYGTLKELLG